MASPTKKTETVRRHKRTKLLKNRQRKVRRALSKAQPVSSKAQQSTPSKSTKGSARA